MKNLSSHHDLVFKVQRLTSYCLVPSVCGCITTSAEPRTLRTNVLERKCCCGNECRQANVNRSPTPPCSTNQSTFLVPCDVSARIIDRPLLCFSLVVCLREADVATAAPLLSGSGDAESALKYVLDGHERSFLIRLSPFI